MSWVVFTLSKNIQWVINLNVHMVAYGRKFLSFRADDFTILALDLPRGRAVLGEAATDNDGFTILFRPVSFFTLVLDGNRDFSNTEHDITLTSYALSWKLNRAKKYIRLTFLDKRFETTAASSGVGFAS